MSIRTVRLDDEAERALADLQKATGLSISAVLKRGLHAYASITEKSAPTKPYDIYSRLDLGPAVNIAARATNRKERVSEIIRNKYRR